MLDSNHLPDTIEVTFTEKDRLTADRYHNNTDCLLGTALHRMGYNTVHPIIVYGSGLTKIGDTWYRPTKPWGVTEIVDWRCRPTERPYYLKSIVGTTLVLRKEDLSSAEYQ